MSSSMQYHSLRNLDSSLGAIQFDQEMRLRRQLFLMWLFVSQEGVLDEAREFVLEHINDPVPFDMDI